MSNVQSGLPPQLQVEKVGKLHKRGAKRHNWLERTFVLKQGALCYFDGKTCKGVIPTKNFTGAKAVEDSWGNKKDKKMPCRFSLNTTERTFYFSTTTWKDMESWIKALESWIGVDNAVTRTRVATVTEEDAPGNQPVIHKCDTCGKTYHNIEDLSTHIVLRHPGAPVPLPAGSGIEDRKVCTECGKWYQLERDLDLHRKKRHGAGAGPGPALTSSASQPAGLGSATINLAMELPDISGFNTMDLSAANKAGLLNDPVAAKSATIDIGEAAKGEQGRENYGLLSLVPKPKEDPNSVDDGPTTPRSNTPEKKEPEDDWGDIDDIMGEMDDLNLDDLDF